MSSVISGYVLIFPSGKNFVLIEFYGKQLIKAGTPLSGGRVDDGEKRAPGGKMLAAERPGINWWGKGIGELFFFFLQLKKNHPLLIGDLKGSREIEHQRYC